MSKNDEAKNAFSKIASFSESSNSNSTADSNKKKHEKVQKEDKATKEKIKPPKKTAKDDGDDGEELSNEGFFENEAELSGSERDSDENYDGESDGSLVFSGDEDDLPDNDELKEQLGQIFL